MASSAINPLSKQHTRALSWRWICGMVYVVAVALIWIAASFVVKSVEGSGVSPFLITYICNSLFIIYIPIIESRRYLERALKEHGWWGKNGYGKLLHEPEKVTELPNQVNGSLERDTLLENVEAASSASGDLRNPTKKEISDETELQYEEDLVTPEGGNVDENGSSGNANAEDGADKPWSRMRTALVGLIICPFWFLAQFTFNLSLKYTTVTSNTILSTTSSMFTFLVSLQFLGERFTWLKLASLTLCMAGTIIVSVGDSWKGSDETASKPFLGDVICLSSAIFYATYTALIRLKIPEEDDEKGRVSTALVFGYLGFFNAVLLAPVALLLHVTGVEPVYTLTPGQFGLIMAKGLLDNVLSDYLWARAVLLTTPTAATAGLTIQVPIAAILDTLRGVLPTFMNIIGAVAVLLGFFGINQADPPTESTPINELDEKEVGDLYLDDAIAISSCLNWASVEHGELINSILYQFVSSRVYTR